ncbi:hypothetical protein V1507DRAFT_256810 [Lipomyces tetrasporus]
MRLAKLNCPHPRPTPTQRQTVSTYIGRHFRNRSAPAKRVQQPLATTTTTTTTRGHLPNCWARRQEQMVNKSSGNRGFAVRVRKAVNSLS